MLLRRKMYASYVSHASISFLQSCSLFRSILMLYRLRAKPAGVSASKLPADMVLCARKGTTTFDEILLN